MPWSFADQDDMLEVDVRRTIDVQPDAAALQPVAHGHVAQALAGGARVDAHPLHEAVTPVEQRDGCAGAPGANDHNVGCCQVVLLRRPLDADGTIFVTRHLSQLGGVRRLMAEQEPHMSENDRPCPATEVFVTHRNLLFTVAYKMLGSASDAEDVLQETWLRSAGVDLDAVHDRRAYLVRITTRQALARLRTLGRRKEPYVGPWLPEPLLTAPDVAEDVELAESLSMAMLLVLETLTPIERAVFVLREVFEFGYDEIAQAVDKSPSAVRQIAHRAREHVAARRPRGVATAAETRAALGAFHRAIESGDLQNLLDILAPDVVALSDGGGVKRAVLRQIVGAETVARLLLAALNKIGAELSLEPAQVNGSPALIMRLNGELDSVVGVRVEGGLVSGLYTVRNPEKLSRLDGETAVTR
jgi:RNA polymerase sigma-70 factor (TIGR02957 family)